MGKPSPTAPGLRTIFRVLWGILAIAAAWAVFSWPGYCPYSVVFSSILLFAACLAPWHRRWAHAAWALFALAWCVALIDTAYGIYRYLHVVADVPAERLQQSIVAIYTEGVATPLLLSVPAVCCILLGGRGGRWPQAWLLLAPVLGLLNLTILTMLLTDVFGLVPL